jgi:hypothetical protein
MTNPLKTITINSRKVVVPAGLTFRAMRAGQYLVEFNGRSHYIVGGKNAGGTAREWTVDNLGNDVIVATSVRDALNLIVGA